MRTARDQITTTLKREFFAQIVKGEKKTEYREIKPYWTDRLDRVSLPFELRLRNGMIPPVPELKVLIDRIKKDTRNRRYCLHIANILKVTNWDKRRERRRKPKA